MNAGDYRGTIVGHGTDTSQSGLPFVWFDVDLTDAETGKRETCRCKCYLEGSTAEKTETAIRMARQTLRLAGFDPDQRGIGDLDSEPTLLHGNEVPVSVSFREFNGKLYPNYDLREPRGVSKDRAAALTDRLRAAKAKDEKPVAAAAPSSKPKPTPAPAAAGQPPFDDIPF